MGVGGEWWWGRGIVVVGSGNRGGVAEARWRRGRGRLAARPGPAGGAARAGWRRGRGRLAARPGPAGGAVGAGWRRGRGRLAARPGNRGDRSERSASLARTRAPKGPDLGESRAPRRPSSQDAGIPQPRGPGPSYSAISLKWHWSTLAINASVARCSYYVALLGERRRDSASPTARRSVDRRRAGAV